ncbi:TetR/AcrR family transcriptional regulator [Vibrio ziniensis]|uniref:TetR/AcrR family transcriptional regulator n=1 Tax=Vibrio ziniensis TaxID=2711221 RepID=A0A6G7CJC5_9VIBR|nr:TetR/AcrR family transcriptional regulator [Vibrio ziniensis]QIH42202.1 TetR/AcrR family transcriptional regulator [Vibrio ziniensis]
MRVKSDEKRQAILDIAKECFSQQGVSGTSMSQLAKELGGSKATLYNYFSSKEEIFAEVMQSSATEQISNSFLSLDVNRDVRTSLLEFGYNFLDSILTPDAISIYRMAVAEADRTDIGRHFYNNGPKKGWKHLSEYIEKQIAKGELSQCNSWIAAMHFKALLSSEYVEQYAFAAIDKPSQQQIKSTVEQAVNAFMKLYGNE